MNNSNKENNRGIKGLIKNANKGNVLSMFELYESYLSGKYVTEKNEALATDYLNKIRENSIEARLFIKSLILYDFRRFKNLDIEFNKDVTVIVGENGAGKTSIVEALARLLTWFNSRMLKAGGNGKRIVEDDINNQAKSYAEVNGLFEFNENTEMSLSIIRPVEGVSASVSSDLGVSDQLGKIYRLFAENKSFSLPLFAFYSVERSLVDFSRSVSESKLRADFNARFSVLKDSLDASAYLGSFFERYLVLVNLSENAETTAAKQYSKLLVLVNHAIESLVSDVENIKVERSSGKAEIILDVFGSRVSASQLSQGQKTLLALAGDIALRLATLNPDSKNALNSFGIIVIDEIDLHLHPKWQQKIIPGLKNTFPNIQFIITTHSPQVLSTVNKEAIRMLSFNEEGEAFVTTPEYQTKGVKSSDVLEQIMDVIATPAIEEAEWVSDYSALIVQNIHDTDEGLKLRKKLIDHFKLEHPVINKLDADIRVAEFKRKVAKKKI